jgi:hypothetical protein
MIELLSPVGAPRARAAAITIPPNLTGDNRVADAQLTIRDTAAVSWWQNTL